MEWKLGNVVQLKSGGPAMTVESVSGDAVGCVWFDRNRLFRDTFKASLLRQPMAPEVNSVSVARL